MTISSIILHTTKLFINAKNKSSLDISKIIKIAIDLAQKIQKIGGLSGPDKKSLLILILKKGLDASEYIQSEHRFTKAMTKQYFEDQILNTASIVVDSVLLAYKRKVDFTKPSKWKNGIPHCLSSIDVVSPDEQLFLKDATEFSESLSKRDSINSHMYSSIFI